MDDASRAARLDAVVVAAAEVSSFAGLDRGAEVLRAAGVHGWSLVVPAELGLYGSLDVENGDGSVHVDFVTRRPVGDEWLIVHGRSR